jgi:nicotinamidase-related amidase
MKKLLFLVVIFLSTVVHVEGQPKRALVVIDIQDFYFPGGDVPLINPEEASNNAGLLLGHFREKDELIVHVRHNYEPGGAIHKSVAPEEGEKVISKDYANSFRETGLEAYLLKNEIEELVIAGMQTHMCVEATTRAAADKGFRCIVISDACTTRDLRFGDREIGWEDVHYSTLSTLKGGYATVLNTKAFLDK